MLEKPDISDELVISRLQAEYNLRGIELTFLPIGADAGTAVYRVITAERTAYFLKLRRGFDEITVTVPLFLKSQGIQEIIVPIQTKRRQYWADLGEYKLILYPFIDGKDGFERDLNDSHRRNLGAALRGIHAARVAPDLEERIPAETFDPRWRERLKSFQHQVEKKTYEDPTAARLAAFMKSKRDQINELIQRAEVLASEIQREPLESVLCHTDIHGGNMLVSDRGDLYIVDWDSPLLAPKERDLMFIGGGIDNLWKSHREEALFYEGYGETKIDLTALAYFRYERIIEDLAVIGEQLFFTGKGGADREQALRWFTGNFEPGQTIEIAKNTDRLLKT